MGFTSKRGRPKTIAIVKGREERDLGTKELQAKRAKRLTAEPIDICKEKAIIGDEQYSAAMHFRWLYTIRFGAPGVSALNMDICGGRATGNNDEEWQAAREREYSMAVEKLRRIGALKIVMNLVVFNYSPRFLKAAGTFSPAQMRQNIEDLCKLRDGLDNLSTLFYPKRKNARIS